MSRALVHSEGGDTLTDRVNERRSRQPAGQIIEQSRTARGPVSVSGIGAHLIRVIIDNDDVQAFQDLTPELFIDDDRRAYEFAVQHYRRHGQLPTTVTLGFNGYRLPEPGDKEPVSYYVEQCQQRAIYNACNRAHGQVLDALRVRDTDGAARIFAETNDRLNELQSRFRNVSEGFAVGSMEL